MEIRTVATDSSTVVFTRREIAALAVCIETALEAVDDDVEFRIRVGTPREDALQLLTRFRRVERIISGHPDEADR